MTRVGWVNHWHFNTSDRGDIAREIDALRIGNESQREQLLQRAEGALTRYFMHLENPDHDIDLMRDRVGEVAKAARQLGDAVKRLDEDSSDAIDEGLFMTDVLHRRPPRGWRKDVEGQMVNLAEAGEWAIKQMSPKRTGPRAGGAARQLYSEVAEGFATIFGFRPSAKAEGPFCQCLYAILRVVGIDEPGETQLVAVLKRNPIVNATPQRRRGRKKATS